MTQTFKTDAAALYARIVPLICIGLLLVFTFRLYTFAYFWIDDFSNLYWVQPKSLSEMVRHVINPSSDFFRPTGMLVYWLAMQVLDRNALGYHIVHWTLHTVNTALIYWVLRRFTNSNPGAAVGAMLFASQYVFSEIYWSFGTIFEVAGLMFYMIGVLVWSRERRSVASAALASAVFVLALKAKEMAITLPVIWLAYDLLLRRNMRWRMAGHFALPAAVGAWYGIRKLAEMQSSSPEHPYYLDLQWLTMGRGFGGYFNAFFAMDLRWQIWAIGFTVSFLLLAILKKRAAVFFQLYIFVSFLPVIFLVNHRHSFYWYFPMLGVCGLAALLTRDSAGRFTRFIPKRLVVPLGSALFALMCHRTYIRTSDLTETRRLWQQGIASEYRAFVSGLQSLSAPDSGETLFFTSQPRYFGDQHLVNATQFALRRTDVDARLVDSFPVGARYRLRFENLQVVSGK